MFCQHNWYYILHVINDYTPLHLLDERTCKTIGSFVANGAIASIFLYPIATYTYSSFFRDRKLPEPTHILSETACGLTPKHTEHAVSNVMRLYRNVGNTLYMWESTCIDYVNKFLHHIGLYNEEPCEKGLYNGLTSPRHHANLMLCVSLFCLPASFFAIYKEHYDLALVPFGVFLTSVNYWRHPTYGWRRNVDMFYVIAGLSWQIHRSTGFENGNLYCVLLFTAMSFYPLSLRVHTRSMWLSTIFHSMIHIMGNVSNIVLYSSNVTNSQ